MQRLTRSTASTSSIAASTRALVEHLGERGISRHPVADRLAMKVVIGRALEQPARGFAEILRRDKPVVQKTIGKILFERVENRLGPGVDPIALLLF